MTRKSMRSALSASLEAEDEAVRSRFEKAESLLGEKPQVSEQPVVAIPVAKEPSKKERVIRDSFTLPSRDYELITAVRQRCLNSAVNVNKSEVIRAGLHALMEMREEDLLDLVNNLEKIKTGRPTEKV